MDDDLRLRSLEDDLRLRSAEERRLESLDDERRLGEDEWSLLEREEEEDCLNIWRDGYSEYVLQGVHEILCFFPRILESLPSLPRQHSAVIGCTKNYKPIGVTVYSHCVEGFEGLYSDVGEGGVVNCEKTQFFMNILYILCS